MSTRASVVHSPLTSSQQSGAFLGKQLREELGGAPDAVILFVSPRHDYEVLLNALHDAAAPKLLVGASSSGEFTQDANADGTACAVGIRSDDLRLSATVGRDLSRDRQAAVRSLIDGFRGLTEDVAARHRTAVIFTDALAGETEDFVERLTELTGGQYAFAGGGAGGDAQFDRRRVFFGREVLPDAAVALEILSDKPVGIGVRHGWKPTTNAMRVTEAQGPTLKSLDAIAAGEVFAEHAQRTAQPFDPNAALPFFLHNVIGVKEGEEFKIRVPLAVSAQDASVQCATEVLAGSMACIMGVQTDDAARAAALSTRAAVDALAGQKPSAALFFDCVATRLRMGSNFGIELDAVRNALGDVPFAGCNSIGQIARAEGQFSGFHNCTAVAIVLPS